MLEEKTVSWIPKGASPADDPHMGDDFARVYEQQGQKVTAQASVAALDLLGIRPRDRVLDIAAGTGSLAVPAAQRGARVLALDIAPGMVRQLAHKLRPFGGCEARVMDGQALVLEDGSFDAAFSMFGVILFADWRKGLLEQARILKAGGKACVATWRRPPGGGPFLIMAQAMRAVFPDRKPPARPEGYLLLSDPKRLSDEMRRAGFVEVQTQEVEVAWTCPPPERYLDELRELHQYMGPYAALGPDERDKVEDAMRAIVKDLSRNGPVVLSTPVLIAVGTRA